MELAHRLAREMDAHRTVSVSRVYAPSEYSVWLSPEDRELYEGVEADLIDELCAYLLEHARRENLMLASPPQIVFHTDERLALGTFGIDARLSSPGGHDGERDREEGLAEGGPEVEHDDWLDSPPLESPPESGVAAEGHGSLRSPSAPSGALRERPPPEPPKHGETLIYSSSQRVGGPVREARERRPSRAMLLVGERRVLVPPPGAVVGRSRECDIVLDDVGVSRRHAEIRPSPEGWTVSDLGSTNGVRLNDRKLRGAQVLALGDRIELGTTEIVFEVR